MRHHFQCRSNVDLHGMNSCELLRLCVQSVCDVTVMPVFQRLTGWAPDSRLVKALRRAEMGSLLLFQLVPHFLIAVSVLVHPEAFSAKVSLSCSCMHHCLP